MNSLKRYLGVLWMIMAPSLVIFMLWQAVEKIGHATAAAKSNTMLQWIIILTIFIPVCVGFFIFGYYCLKGEYDHLPENSKEV
ncbi:MAG TPA: hypothetical protein PK006_08615 [Saprospiraceae bacterium]|nr:hypothetical protein [Saprospiraceae bacterium]